MSSIRYNQQDRLSPSLRRTVVGQTGLQKRLFSDGRKNSGGV